MSRSTKCTTCGCPYVLNLARFCVCANLFCKWYDKTHYNGLDFWGTAIVDQFVEREAKARRERALDEELRKGSRLNSLP